MTAVEENLPQADVSCTLVGRRAVLTVSGEVDIATAPTLTAAIDDALAAGAGELWIDLTATVFMDSSGLHALLQAQRRTSELRRRLAVICPGGAVRRLFEIAGVADWLPIFDDRATAHRAA